MPVLMIFTEKKNEKNFEKFPKFFEIFSKIFRNPRFSNDRK
jgi:hypothetical protein